MKGTRFIILLKIAEICRLVRGKIADYKCITRPGVAVPKDFDFWIYEGRTFLPR